MRQIVLPLILLALCACSAEGPSGTRNYTALENNLIEFQSPARVFDPDSLQCAHPLALVERMAFYDTPGVSVAIVEDDAVVWAKAYGTLDVETGAPVTTESIFEAASTSKLLTAVMALSCVEKGLIDLDTDINQYLKSWRMAENEFTTHEKVTLRRLLTHTAGLPMTNFSQDESGRSPTLDDVLNGAAPAVNAPATPELTPGEQWQYSNIGFVVIQRLLEDVSGRTFEEIARETIFDPLAMTRSTFNYPLEPEMRPFEAMPHDAEGISREPAMHMSAFAHGGLTTTPGDLAKFLNALIQSYNGKSETLLSTESARKLMNTEKDLDPGMFGLPLSEGLGVLLLGEGEDFLFMMPGSNLPGLNCWLVGWPEKNRGIVVMTNGAKGELLAMEVVTAFGVGGV